MKKTLIPALLLSTNLLASGPELIIRNISYPEQPELHISCYDEACRFLNMKYGESMGILNRQFTQSEVAIGRHLHLNKYENDFPEILEFSRLLVQGAKTNVKEGFYGEASLRYAVLPLAIATDLSLALPFEALGSIGNQIERLEVTGSRIGYHSSLMLEQALGKGTQSIELKEKLFKERVDYLCQEARVAMSPEVDDLINQFILKSENAKCRVIETKKFNPFAFYQNSLSLVIHGKTVIKDAENSLGIGSLYSRLQKSIDAGECD